MLKLVEILMLFQHLLIREIGIHVDFIDRNRDLATSALRRKTATCPLDKNPQHRLRGRREELRPVSP